MYFIIITSFILFNEQMSFLPRGPTQEPLKASQKVNKLQIPNSSYLKSFKKTISNQNHTSHNQKLKVEQNQRSFANDENMRPYKSKQKNRSQFDHLKYVMEQTDNSMEELLNSSINQFEKLIIHQDISQSLQQQNYRLKNALSKMKTILRDKLETALQKQKEELSKMLEDYISLITKLLQDKQELTIKIQDMADQNQNKIKQIQLQYSKHVKEMSEERDEQITSTKNQIEEFLAIIEQYEEQAKQQQAKFAELQERIDQLEQERDNLIDRLNKEGSEDDQHQQDNNYCMKLQAQSTKIQTLLQLLEKNQQQNNDLKQQLSHLKSRQNTNRSSESVRQIREAYEKRIIQIEQEHQEQFLQYEKTIRDTIVKKDQCIQRLNLIIEGLRQRKANH